MTHRSDLTWLDVNDTLQTVKRKAAAQLHSAYPVSDGDLDNIQGIVLVRDLFLAGEQEAFQLSDFVKQPLYAPSSTPANKVLENSSTSASTTP